jgi:glycosyltransferase involved in cell wall biosynthesis
MISILVPVYDEGQSLDALHAEILAALARVGGDAEILFVDDGSRDGSWARIAALCAADARTRGVRLRRNFGKSAALAAGIAVARGTTIVTLDADGQDDPAEIPALVADLEGKSLDVVCGWKQKRADPLDKRLASRVFNAMVNFTFGLALHDHNCGQKAFRAEVLREIPLHPGELHRFLPALAHARGFRIGERAVVNRARAHRRSK